MLRRVPATSRDWQIAAQVTFPSLSPFLFHLLCPPTFTTLSDQHLISSLLLSRVPVVFPFPYFNLYLLHHPFSILQMDLLKHNLIIYLLDWNFSWLRMTLPMMTFQAPHELAPANSSPNWCAHHTHFCSCCPAPALFLFGMCHFMLQTLCTCPFCSISCLS